MPRSQPPLGPTYRGVIEGFYGPLWTHEDRLHLLRHLRAWSMNLYIYAPKNDPYHRFRWETLYPREEMRKFAELGKVARRERAMLSIAISPGNTFDPKSRAHRSKLLRKIDQFIDVGCEFFPILYDDLHGFTDFKSPQAATHAENQASLMNDLVEAIGLKVPRARFLFCPTEYGTAEKSVYLSRLHERLDPRVETVCTGYDGPGYVIAAKTLSNEGAQRYADNFGRKPFIWDNYNVSDWTLTALNWSPYHGRGDRLDELTSGIVVNPQVVYRVNLPVFQAMGKYFANPRRYDARKAMDAAIKAQLGPGAAVGRTLSKWYTTEVSGYISAEQNLPALPEKIANDAPRRKLLRAIRAAVTPTLNFHTDFDYALMPPDWAGHLGSYCHVLKWWSYSLNHLCEQALKQTPVSDDLAKQIRQWMQELRTYSYRLPASLPAYTERVLELVSS